ncbi:hypothetical protein KV708_08565 [Comamonas thiooxydans]|uniref:hypothetical protein n=1 Tax=Comamonas thiooxydans TaxID=363952 RepID=UPI00070D6DE4|nr:hypothetical protein [Comamonas thiooxydans]
MNRKPDIELTEGELLLLKEIKFNARSHDELRALIGPMASLATSLLDREAIPEVRLLYFTEAERHPSGRGKSRQDVFEANGTVGDEILSHPHFLKYLEYFIFGPALPQQTIESFKDAAQFGEHLSRSDMSDLLPTAKQMVKSQRLDPNIAAEEFHKLALECGALPSTASSLRDSIRKIRIS